MAKHRFKYYLHDDYTGSERAEEILKQINLDLSRDQLIDKIGRPFYEVELLCELDDETWKVEIISAKL
jgi:hypothetical protein